MWSNKWPINIELFRGAVLLLVRWLVHYPVVFCTYKIRNFRGAPFRRNPSLGDAPGIVVGNYGNYFFDDLIGMMLPPVRPYVFVRYKWFHAWWFQLLFRWARVLPVLRSVDQGVDRKQRSFIHEKMFDSIVQLLRNRQWLSVFPEQYPGHRPQIRTPLKPGMAHVALRAEEAEGWKLGLRIYVYATNYENKFSGRSYVYLRFAEPIEVAKYRTNYDLDRATAVKLLMLEIESKLRACTLEASSLDNIVAAHRLAYQLGEQNFQGVKRALLEVEEGSNAPARLDLVQCSLPESLFYRAVALVMVVASTLVGYPVRTFGLLCASERSQEMTFQFIFWSSMLMVGFVFGGLNWVLLMFVLTWALMKTWMFAFRRGLVD